MNTTAAFPRLLRMPKVTEATGLSRSTIYAKAAEGTFPQPVPLGERASAWLESEVSAWITERVAQRDAARTAT